MVRAVVPEDDCTRTVNNIPTIIPFNGVFVVFSIIDLSLFPAAAFSESLMKLIPYKKSERPPKTNIMFCPTPAIAIDIISSAC